MKKNREGKYKSIIAVIAAAIALSGCQVGSSELETDEIMLRIDADLNIDGINFRAKLSTDKNTVMGMPADVYLNGGDQLVLKHENEKKPLVEVIENDTKSYEVSLPLVTRKEFELEFERKNGNTSKLEIPFKDTLEIWTDLALPEVSREYPSLGLNLENTEGWLVVDIELLCPENASITLLTLSNPEPYNSIDLDELIRNTQYGDDIDPWNAISNCTFGLTAILSNYDNIDNSEFTYVDLHKSVTKQLFVDIYSSTVN